MDKQEDPPKRVGLGADGTAGEAAFQVLEMLLLMLIDKRIIEPDTLIAEIESLASATPDIGRPPSALTLKGQLGELANSLSTYTKKND